MRAYLQLRPETVLWHCEHPDRKYRLRHLEFWGLTVLILGRNYLFALILFREEAWTLRDGKAVENLRRHLAVI